MSFKIIGQEKSRLTTNYLPRVSLNIIIIIIKQRQRILFQLLNPIYVIIISSVCMHKKKERRKYVICQIQTKNYIFETMLDEESRSW